MKFGWKKKDCILIAAVLCVAAGVFVFRLFCNRAGEGSVVVKVDGEITGVYDLEEDQEIVINQGSNVLVIRDGTADMTEADCPDKLCVHQRAIDADGESIICLPNKIIVEVRSDTERQLDSVTN